MAIPKSVILSTNSVNLSYPFGMVMPGREYTSAEYKFGYNGKEKDNENTASLIAFEFRNFDSRLARFQSIDPIGVQFPWQSGFSYFRNCPITILDYLGLGGDEGNESTNRDFTYDNSASKNYNNGISERFRSNNSPDNPNQSGWRNFRWNLKMLLTWGTSNYSKLCDKEKSYKSNDVAGSKVNTTSIKVLEDGISVFYRPSAFNQTCNKAEGGGSSSIISSSSSSSGGGPPAIVGGGPGIQAFQLNCCTLNPSAGCPWTVGSTPAILNSIQAVNTGAPMGSNVQITLNWQSTGLALPGIVRPGGVVTTPIDAIANQITVFDMMGRTLVTSNPTLPFQTLIFNVPNGSLLRIMIATAGPTPIDSDCYNAVFTSP